MPNSGAIRPITALVGIAGCVGLILLIREVIRLREQNELLISAGEVYREAARSRRG